MGLMKYVFEQAGKPRGKFGELFAMSMNLGHSKLTRWGLSYLTVNPEDFVLDVGCGGGKTVSRLAKIAREGKVWGVDYSDASVAAATRANRKSIDNGQVKILKASVSELPFPGEMFDLVTAVETCYFWPDFHENLKEIYRVLKPGGSFVIINEAYKNEKFEKRNSSIANTCKFLYYLPLEFKEYFEKAGFSQIRIKTIESKNWITVIGRK
jgi:ubiquinone/menaquinone biosynthesis C-methylase UbiE